MTNWLCFIHCKIIFNWRFHMLYRWFPHKIFWVENNSINMVNINIIWMKKIMNQNMEKTMDKRIYKTRWRWFVCLLYYVVYFGSFLNLNFFLFHFTRWAPYDYHNVYNVYCYVFNFFHMLYVLFNFIFYLILFDTKHLFTGPGRLLCFDNDVLFYGPLLNECSVWCIIAKMVTRTSLYPLNHFFKW